MATNNTNLPEELERLIDTFGLARVLSTIGEVCQEKAEHVRTNWQDMGLAYLWDKAGKAVEKSAANKDVVSLSM